MLIIYVVLNEKIKKTIIFFCVFTSGLGLLNPTLVFQTKL